MKIRAKTTFVGTFNMKKDEIKECDDRRVVNDLKKLGLVEDVPEEKELNSTLLRSMNYERVWRK